jgi:hypothetical protein
LTALAHDSPLGPIPKFLVEPFWTCVHYLDHVSAGKIRLSQRAEIAAGLLDVWIALNALESATLVQEVQEYWTAYKTPSDMVVAELANIAQAIERLAFTLRRYPPLVDETVRGMLRSAADDTTRIPHSDWWADLARRISAMNVGDPRDLGVGLSRAAKLMRVPMRQQYAVLRMDVRELIQRNCGLQIKEIDYITAKLLAELFGFPPLKATERVRIRRDGRIGRQRTS